MKKRIVYKNKDYLYVKTKRVGLIDKVKTYVSIEYTQDFDGKYTYNILLRHKITLLAKLLISLCVVVGSLLVALIKLIFLVLSFDFKQIVDFKKHKENVINLYYILIGTLATEDIEATYTTYKRVSSLDELVELVKSAVRFEKKKIKV
ncbi:hypothetical protein [Ligilactobacillus salivarius]|jgi:hypothetical protein|uniref:hypothetical protein n=1 Tax=Ligilactobacillus salivarius TaxID=1624 RepID=UPI00136EC5F2|nr:hypothetical protein [Ligilactobacillus salivarius]MYV14846.1 hypothetical protein [Ligilactobacillus salivarius]MYZ83793.1 hypothetical protein [Ligilactobacillus salivarius]DAT81110.1 MAG TPA: hypothetical protein [Caudoviricetes sp.]